MLGLFDCDTGARDGLKNLAYEFYTLIGVLIEKGIITADDITKMKPKMTALLDQELAKAREEQIANMSESEKFMYQLFGLKPGATL